jgi:cytoskeletal protein CcmA (bactofilin family)/predicted RNA-binding Zn-ribbon protein involved in translation (DUF1610 family)
MISWSSKPINPKIKVTCTHCGHVQLDYQDLGKSTCQACGKLFWFNAPPKRKSVQRPKIERRLLVCHVCGEELKIPKDALSWQCHGCSTQLDVADHTINGENASRILTYGTVTIHDKGQATASKLQAGSVILSGRVSGRVICQEELLVRGHGILHMGAKTKKLMVEAGAVLHAEQTIEAETVEIFGEVRGRQLIVRQSCHLGPHAKVDLTRLLCRGLTVQEGGRLRARASTRMEPSASGT